MITALLLLQLLALVQAANWNTDVRILATERLDPIISPNGVASHMHSIIGGSAFGAAYNQPDSMNSKCTSFPISVDKSNYWHPKPYWINNNGTSFTPLPISNRVYYIREKNSPNDWIRPFPEGLRMIVGSPFNKAPDSRSFQYLCRVADKFNGPGDIWSDHWNFERDCPRGILAQHKFPPCWDGVNLYKSDQSHMAFPQWGAHYGACPASHPIRLPGIMLEVYIQTYRWAPGETIKGKLAWANGDTTGYGIHADFTNGWDTAILGRALNDTACGTSADITFQACPVFQPFITDAACSPDKGVMTEATQHVDMIPISRLPGCNPLWGSGPKPGCSSMPPDPDPSAFKGTDGPLVAAQSVVPPLPTIAGWKAISCIKDSDNMLLNKIRTYDNNVSQTSCLDSCLRSGYSYASIGFAWGQSWVCDCGTGLDPKASTYPGMCNMTCPTNSAQGCGGSGAHYVFYAPNNTKTEGNYTASMGCYANPPAGKVGLQDVASYNFTSWNLMTRELCGQACADRKLDWAGIKSGGICYCGSAQTFKLGDGYYVNDALCTDKCAGNKTQACGYWGGLSVFNVSTSGYKETTLNKAPGYVQCYADGSRTSLTGAQYWDGALTPQKCQFGCKDLGFALASVYNGNMCLCGDKLSNVATLPTSMCSTKCSDNSTAYTCGGPGNGELYETSAVSAQVAAFNAKRPSGWKGCFANSANNVTADITVNEGKLTVTRCIAACGELGYPWAGVQNREQCRCSKADPRANTKAVAANNFCVIPCNGDATQQCGGWNYVDLYYNPTTSTKPNATNTTDDGVPALAGYKGCFNGSAALPAYSWWSAQMTVDICQQGCKEIGQPLSALSAGTCSCGPTWTGGARLTSLSCGTVCGGNSNQRCGGWPGQTSLYDSAPGAATPSPAGYMGCWSETTPKALQGFGVWSDAQSVDNCRSICSAKGYALSGLNNGKQCWCGNALGTASKRVPSQFCAASCPGNASQNCGQWNTIALYRSSGEAAVNSSSASPVAVSTNSSSSLRASTVTGSTSYSSSSRPVSSSVRSATSASPSNATVALSSLTLSGSSRSSSAASLSASARNASTATGSPISVFTNARNATSTFASNTSVTLTSPSISSSVRAVLSSGSPSVASNRSTTASGTPSTTAAFRAASVNGTAGTTVRVSSSSRLVVSSSSTDSASTSVARSSSATVIKSTTSAVSSSVASTSKSSTSSLSSAPKSSATGTIASSARSSSSSPASSSTKTVVPSSASSAPAPANTTADYLGCFADQNSARVYSAWNTTATNMTPSICQAACLGRDKSYTYFGTSLGNQCWCAVTPPNVATNKLLDETLCNFPCAGNSTLKCGGNSTVSAWGPNGAAKRLAARGTARRRRRMVMPVGH